MEYSSLNPSDYSNNFLLQSLICQKKDSLKVLSQEDRKTLDVLLNFWLSKSESSQALTKEKGIDQHRIESLVNHLNSPLLSAKKEKFSLLKSFKNISTKKLKKKIENLEKKITLTSKQDLRTHKRVEMEKDEMEKEMNPDKIKSAAEEMLKGEKAQEEKEGTSAFIYTLAHKLYDKAAEIYIGQGNLEKAFKTRLEAANCIPFTRMHPLYEMEQALSNQAKQQLDERFGGYFSSFGTEIVKGGNIRAFNRNIEGKDKHCLQFKVNAFAREELSKTVELLALAVDQLPHFFHKELGVEGIKIKEIDYTFKGPNREGIFSSDEKYSYTPDRDKARAIEIEFRGLGKVTIGNAPGWCLHNVVNAEIDREIQPGEGGKRLQQMFSLLGLGPVLGAQPPDIDEKIKIAQLFRAYFPTEAYEMERTKEFFTSTSQQMRRDIEAKVPKMIPIFKKYLEIQPELMKKEDIYPGKTTWAINDFSQKMKEEGAWGLFAAISVHNPFEVAAKNLIRILKSGALSSQDRFDAGILIAGCSSREDLACGGGDQVFTRLITPFREREISGKIKEKAWKISDLPFSSHIHVLYDLDVVNRGAYAYTEDKFGEKYTAAYHGRCNLIEITQQVRDSNPGNEVMIKNYIAPDKIRRIIVAGQKQKEMLIDMLIDEQLVVEVGEDNQFLKKGERFLETGQSLDEFIVVADELKPELWDRVYQVDPKMWAST